MDCSLPGFSVHGMLQARILEWVAMSSFRGSSALRDWIRVSCLLFQAGILPLHTSWKAPTKRGCPGGLVVRVPGFHCSGTSSIPDPGTDILQGVFHRQHTQTHTHLCICVCVFTHTHSIFKNNYIHSVKLPKWSDIFTCIQVFCFERIKLNFLHNVPCIFNMTIFDLSLHFSGIYFFISLFSLFFFGKKIHWFSFNFCLCLLPQLAGILLMSLCDFLLSKQSIPLSF